MNAFVSTSHRNSQRKGEGKATAQEILSLAQHLRRHRPTYRVRPADILALWFGDTCKQWITVEEALRVMDTSHYPFGDRDAYTVPGYSAIYVIADDRSTHAAFYTE